MQFVQVVFTDDQALKLVLSLDAILSDPERFVMTEEERADFERLHVFLEQVAANPQAFPPTGENAERVKRTVRRAKGPARRGRWNPRKARQEKRMRTAKARRKERRELTAQFNAARERYEQDIAELEAAQAEAEERMKNEPRFDIIGPDGQLMLSGVPESAIRAADGEPLTPGAPLPPKVILPGTAEALGLEAA